MIVISQLVKKYDHHTILDRLDLRVNDGEWVAIAGANGAGKTTLLRVLAGLSGFDSGEVWINGISLKDEALRARAQTGYVGHQPLLYGDLSAEENLQFYCGLYDVLDPAKKIEGYLCALDLQKSRKQKVKTFSRGMQQRLTLIRALLHEPKICLLDEPFSSLDEEVFESIVGLFKDLTHEGKTLIMTTPDTKFIAQSVTRRMLLKNGMLNELPLRQKSVEAKGRI